MTHIIASGRVFLRPFEASDAEIYRRWRAEAEPMALAGWHERAPLEPRPGRAADRENRRRPGQGGLHLRHLPGRRRAADRGGDARRVSTGVNGSAAVGIVIGEPDEWGKGYGTDAVRALVDFGFAELRLERIWLEVGTENLRAKRSYEKAGFTHEGTFRHDRWEGGRYTDGHVMSILHDEWQSRRS